MIKIFYGWWIVVACFIFCFLIGGIVFASFTAFFDPLIREFGWSYTQVSFAFSLRGFEMSLFAPLLGFLIGRFGTRNLIFSGVIIVGLGLILLSTTESLPMFYGAFLFMSLGAGGCGGVVTMAAVSNWFNKNIGKVLGIASSGYGASGLVVPIVVWLIDTYKWRPTLVILGIVVLLLCIPLSLVIRERPEDYGYLPDGLPIGEPVTNIEHEVKEVKIGLKEVLKHKSFLSLVVIDIIRQMMISTIALHVIPYLSSKGIARMTAGIVTATFPFLSIVGRLLFGWMGDMYDKRYTLALAFFFVALGFLFFCYVDHSWAMLAFLIFFSIGLGATMVTERTVLRAYFGREYFGRLLGIIMGFASVGGIVGPTFAGGVFDTLRSYISVWLLYCGCSVFAMLLALRMKPVAAGKDSPFKSIN
ncbi:MFS transporter [Thermodesulfobacteriota bacterium]